MKSKKILSLTALASCVALLLAGCGGGDDADTTVATTAITTTATAEAETTAEAAETTYINVTDENGATVTDADGAPVTEAVTVTTAAPTDAEATPDSSGTEAAPATTAAEPDRGVNLPPETPTTTTVKRVEQTAPPKTTAATTPAPTSPPTTAADTRPTILDAKGRPVNLYPNDPWKYPYDVDECLRQCKAYVESLGMRWGEEAALDDGSWAGCIGTGSYTYEYSWNYYDNLFENVKDGISFHHNEGATRCKVIFLPKGIADGEPVDGEYDIYIVY